MDRDFRQQVVAAVKAKLGHYHWFSGVCLDGIEEYEPCEIGSGDLQGAIEHAYCETLYWDAPNQGLDLKETA